MSSQRGNALLDVVTERSQLCVRCSPDTTNDDTAQRSGITHATPGGKLSHPACRDRGVVAPPPCRNSSWYTQHDELWPYWFPVPPLSIGDPKAKTSSDVERFTLGNIVCFVVTDLQNEIARLPETGTRKEQTILDD